MYTVYVLYSRRYNKIYIGYTSNLEQRLLSHNELSNKGWTARYRPWHLIYTEEYEEKGKAMQRERALKSARGREFIWRLIAAKFQNVPRRQ
ncbi:MAG: GIY-YIG nuclease family protein [candidate division KSB1 bacterium]|nr:GIY-YIG nuclease family protein [candidate division KSB1 bacterium]